MEWIIIKSRQILIVVVFKNKLLPCIKELQNNLKNIPTFFDENSLEVNKSTSISLDKNDLIETLLEFELKNPARDKACIIAKETTIGFSRQQPTNPGSRYTGTLCLSFFSQIRFIVS